MNVRLVSQPMLLQPVPPETQVKEYSTMPESSVAVTAVMLMLVVLAAVGGDCQLIWAGEGGVVSVSDSVVALAVPEALFILPAASRALTV